MRPYAKGRASCQITGTDLSSVALEVVAPKPADVVATLTTTSPDSDPGNNTWRADLG